MSQIGRQIASSAGVRNHRLGPDFQPVRTAKDSPSSGSSRISNRQLDQIQTQLTDQHRAVLLFLAQVRLASADQVARRLWAARVPTDSRAQTARRALRRLELWRVIDRLPRRIGGIRGGSTSLIYRIGPAGRRLLGRMGYEPKRLHIPGDRYIAHTLSITELGVRLHQASLAGTLDLIELQTEPTCWRAFLGLMGARFVLKPDLFVRLGVGAFEDRWFVEVDLATEATPTIVSKAKRYVAYYRAGEEQRRHGVYPRVVWTVPHRDRREQLAEALRHLPPGAQQLFVVWPYDEVVGRLAAEARS
jgi:hypothetical protein